MSKPTIQEVISYCKANGFSDAAIRARLQSAADDCTRFIAIEAPRSAELRPVATQQHLDFCVAHREALQAAIASLGAAAA